MICQLDSRRHPEKQGQPFCGTIDHHWVTTNRVHLDHRAGIVRIPSVRLPLRWIMHSLRATQVRR